ncbi:MAG: M13 family metallopeptidase [Acidobacteria bacterium]|nr:M13 family metallopeptidase [Acidobacteriota bacterium]
MSRYAFAAFLMVGLSLGAKDPATTGIDMSHMDQNVRPQDDFFLFVNGTWMKEAEIPGDRPAAGAFFQLRDQSESHQLAILEQLASAERKPGSAEQRLHDFYASFMDQEAIDKLGSQPVQPILKKIDGIGNHASLADTFAWLSQTGFNHPISFYVMADVNDSEKNRLYFSQSGLTLPNRDYYLKDDAKLQAVREKLPEYAMTLMKLANQPVHDSLGQEILNFETELAKIQWPIEDVQDVEKTNNPTQASDLASFGSVVGLDRYMTALAPGTEKLNLNEPTYFKALNELLEKTPLAVIKSYLKFHIIDETANDMSRDFEQARFDFHGKLISGLSELTPRWKRGIRGCNGAMGELLGQLYVAKYFPPASKQRMDELVNNLLKAMDSSIDDLDWMTDTTKKKAKEKLSRFTAHIGYPDTWKTYEGLEIKAGDHFGNALRSAQWAIGDMIGKLNKPVDRNEWGMTPQMVNAYYSPVHNKVVFPAAILQPPFFNPEADDAVNYGAIGAVIGHEISHGFDDQGRKFDGSGNLNDWWTADDNTAFEARAKNLVSQYDGFEALEGLNVNGTLTLGENIGDLSGLTIAYRAYRASLGGKEAPVIDGYNGDQRFFLGFGQIWRMKLRDEYLRMMVLSDEHAPPMFRVNGTLANMPEFHKAFKVAPGDKLYRDASQIVKIW